MARTSLLTALTLSLSAFCLAAARPRFETLVTFGDSYTDQSRLSAWFVNGTAPPPHYQEVYPPADFAANGGTTWVRYAEIDGNIKSFNYAVSGAACSNNLTGRPGALPDPPFPDGIFPDVLGYEIPALFTDFLTTDANGRSQLSLDPDTTVFSIWIGTNDVGFGALLTGNQTAGVTIVNVTECVIDWARTLYSAGARNFIFQNMIPLELTPLYNSIDQPLDRYWPFEHNRTQYAIEMRGLVEAGNTLWDLQVPLLMTQLKGAQAAIFNSNSLFRQMYENPQNFLNGTLPLNVTGYAAHSDINGDNTVVAPNVDSFLWYDSLHPGEQTDRNVAEKFVAAMQGSGEFATFFGNNGRQPTWL